MGSVNGKVVLITGGANGIGAEVARRLHDKGAKLVLIDIDETLLEEVAARLGGDRVLSAVADVRDLAEMQTATDQGIDRFGGIDIVIANAGIATFGSVLNVDPAAFKTVLDVNALGVFNTVRAALPSVIERRGYVLVVSSLGGYAPVAGLAAYSLTKAGVEHFANSLRLEVGHLGVDVGSAHMCWIDTPLVREGKAESAAFGDMIASLPAPLNKTASVARCGEAFVKGIEGRKRQINYPGWVRVFRWLRPLLTTAVGERQLVNGVPQRMARMDAEAAALGRSMSERTQGLENR
jgi:NAD(P)-dependent dehydrogenase (short-subunit alcohol dehydrogenase family)